MFEQTLNKDQRPGNRIGAPIHGLSNHSSSVPQTEAEYYLLEYLSHLYGGGIAPDITRALLNIAGADTNTVTTVRKKLSQEDILLISYGDTLTDGERPPLQVLKEFADGHLADYFSGIHILPFFPFSSDDGFAVVDYSKVREDLGKWQDVKALSEQFDLMFDLVINHCSREHIWFADFINGRTPGCDFFVELPAETDVSAVVRPRNTPLLSQVQTYAGLQYVWTTFSEDQIDLNFQNPDVLCIFVEILFDYVAKGANFIRLDAIAFLWKQASGPSMSLPETHMVVKVMRLLLDYSGANVRLLTETNVPHAENISYFGQQDEAHMVYQFSLAPLLLYSYLFNDGHYLQEWAIALSPPPEGCAYLNFIASHDGIGLRPLEGLVPVEEVDKLIDCVHNNGGFISMRTGDDGTPKAYELNISLFSAFGGEDDGENEAENTAVPAFVAAHQLLLAFQGVPALYLRAMFGSLNDMQAVERTGRTRSINRGQLELSGINAELEDTGNVHAKVFRALTQSLARRKRQPAFNPDASQEILPSSSDCFVMLRCSPRQSILVVASFLPIEQAVDLSTFSGINAPADNHVTDLLTDTRYPPHTPLLLAPYQVVWLELDGG